MMRVSVKMYRTDCLAEEEELLVEAIGILNGDRILYKEDEKKGYVQTVVFHDDRILIERKADVNTLVFLSRKNSHSRVSSEYGEMKLEAHLVGCEKKENEWTVEYRILNGNDVAVHQKIVWKFQPVN